MKIMETGLWDRKKGKLFHLPIIFSKIFNFHHIVFQFRDLLNRKKFSFGMIVKIRKTMNKHVLVIKLQQTYKA